MELKIAAKDKGRWSWTIVYSGQPERAYELVAVPDSPGSFVLDERNGILLDVRLENNELLSAFEVGGRLLLTRYTLQAELSSLRYQPQTFQKGEMGPQKVASWKTTTLQSATLKRVGS